MDFFYLNILLSRLPCPILTETSFLSFNLYSDFCQGFSSLLFWPKTFAFILTRALSVHLLKEMYSQRFRRLITCGKGTSGCFEKMPFKINFRSVRPYVFKYERCDWPILVISFFFSRNSLYRKLGLWTFNA